MPPDSGFSDGLILSACFDAPPAGAGGSNDLIDREGGVFGAIRGNGFMDEFAAFGTGAPLSWTIGTA
jgi:hypothetical protein